MMDGSCTDDRIAGMLRGDGVVGGQFSVALLARKGLMCINLARVCVKMDKVNKVNK
jgi:hypothetical protein